MGQGWINLGFLVLQPEFFDLIPDDTTILEREPLKVEARMSELMAYRHYGFWQCMDTKRDLGVLQDFWNSGAAQWKK
jgi:glucose-1-phosphate cytidylyltransferase